MQQIVSRVQVRFDGLQVLKAVLLLHENGSERVQLLLQLLKALGRLFSLGFDVIGVVYPGICGRLVFEQEWPGIRPLQLC